MVGDGNGNEIIESIERPSVVDVDYLVSTINTENFQSYKDFSAHLTKNFSKQYNKVRSIYSWIANNVTYNHQNYQDQSAEYVWENREAICEGYANLFNAMCEASGIESRMVKGYVRDYSGREIKFPNHAWNSVKIDGKWHLFDVTWASVNTSSDIMGSDTFNNMYRKHKLDYFFMVNPDKMILTHLPEDPLWQLQANTIDFNTFLRGEISVEDKLKSPSYKINKNFELLISNYEMLDSLDRTIAYMERMVANMNNKVREYGLGVAYYYKAQNVLKDLGGKDYNTTQSIKKQARNYYRKSLENLSKLEEHDFGYKFSRDLADNVSLKIDVLQ